MIKKIIFLFLFLVLSKISFGDSIVLCLSNSKICVTLYLDGDEWKTGKSVYCKHKQTFSLKQRKYISIKDYPDHPSVFLIQWNEYVVGKMVGYYSVELQGANFYNAYYYNTKTKKKIKLNVRTLNDEDTCN